MILARLDSRRQRLALAACSIALITATLITTRAGRYVAIVLILAPVCEELVFRDMAWRLVRRYYAEAVSVGITSTLFGLAHLPRILSGDGYSTAAAWLCGYFAAGVALGLCRARHGLFWAIALHAALNSVYLLLDAVGLWPAQSF